MRITKTHISRQRALKHRQLDKNFGFIYWMNSRRAAKEVQRIVSVLKVIQELEKLNQQGDFPTMNVNPRKRGLDGTNAQRANLRNANSLSKRLERLLSRYRSSPSYISIGQHRNALSWRNLLNKKTVEVPVEGGGDFSSYPFGEGDALFRIDRLIYEGELNRVRNCSCCNKWFFAGNSRKEYCSGSCQVRQFRKKPEQRANWAAYMRKYRHNERERSEKLRKVR
jgi:hypothetical protein